MSCRDYFSRPTQDIDAGYPQNLGIARRKSGERERNVWAGSPCPKKRQRSSGRSRRFLVARGHPPSTPLPCSALWVGLNRQFGQRAETVVAQGQRYRAIPIATYSAAASSPPATVKLFIRCGESSRRRGGKPQTRGVAREDKGLGRRFSPFPSPSQCQAPAGSLLTGSVTLNAATGRLRPFTSRFPRSSSLAISSTAPARRLLTRICPSLA